ncbi:hypothetical protein LTR35_017483 [Friedmanniomyces endolithicus]|nr:hypothetical protein LTR35_017483 [Friedmanniomyces endolithicus]KAK0269423.1 hypothetical protein LTS00_017286 [Friedmanniomyces endolithicus]
MGDLLGSQWIGEDEFARRNKRFWEVFKGTDRVPRGITDVSGRAERLGQDAAWEKRVIALAGNHDIGYAGEIDRHRIERFEDKFGGVNWDVHFRLENASSTAQPANSPFTPNPFASPPKLHVIMLNSMNLDGPADTPDLHRQSKDFLNEQLRQGTHSGGTWTLLLTHISFHKRMGICADAPFFSYFPPDQGGGIGDRTTSATV